MKPDLKKRIKEFNKIKFSHDKEKRIIVQTLKPVKDQTMTIAS